MSIKDVIMAGFLFVGPDKPVSDTNPDTCLLHCHGPGIFRAAYKMLYAALDDLRCKSVDEKALSV